MTFRLEDGRMLDLREGDMQLRHIDRVWASTVHAFQGRTVDTVIAAMEASHPHFTTQETLYVEISRARHRVELVTDDASRLRGQLEAVTGERLSALEGIRYGVDRRKAWTRMRYARRISRSDAVGSARSPLCRFARASSPHPLRGR